VKRLVFTIPGADWEMVKMKDLVKEHQGERIPGQNQIFVLDLFN